jgi:His/Glu/Gln/Arg/opine family amino acid ABC transporter permease subunit
MDFQLDIFLESFPTLLKGAVLTVELTIISVILGLFIGLIGALGRLSRNRMLRAITVCYITVMRAVPLLLTLMFLYYGLPSVGIDLSAFNITLVALSITTSAYVTYIILSHI